LGSSARYNNNALEERERRRRKPSFFLSFPPSFVVKQGNAPDKRERVFNKQTHTRIISKEERETIIHFCKREMATTTHNNSSNSAHKQFETGHADQIHDCQYDYYGRVRFLFLFLGFFLLCV